MINPNKPQQVGQRLPMWTYRAVALFFSLLLLSESTVASVGSYGLKIAQQPATNPSVPLSPDKQQRYQEGVKLYQEGQELYKKGTKEGYQQAIEKYQQALKIAQEIGLRQEEAFIHHSIGTVYFLLSDNKNALSFYKQALTIWEKLNQPVDKAAVQYSIGQAHANVGEYNTALEYYQKAELIFREKQEFFFLSRTLRATALAYIRLGNMDKALNSLNQALGICRNTLKDSVCEANILNSIGLLYSQKLDSKAAFENYNQALEIRRKNKDLSGQAETLREIAALMSKLGKHKEALQHLEAAQKLLQGKNTPIEQGLILDGIGDVYGSLGDFQKAVNYHKQSRILFSQAGEITLESLSIGTIISIYRNFTGDYQQALVYIEEALALHRKAGDKEQEASTLNQKGDIYIRQGNYQLALDAYHQALEIERSITKNPKAEARTLGNIALLYNFLGDSNLSISHYNQVLDIYRKLDDKKQQARTFNYIGGVYQSNRKFDEALKFYNQALGLFNKEDYKSEIAIRWGLAKTYRDKNDYSKAFEAANRALELSKQYQYSFQETASIEIVGSIYLVKEDYKNALDNYTKAIKNYRKTGLLKKEAEILNTIGIAYSSQKQYQQAIDTLNEELKIRRILKDIQGEADALYGIAINQRKLGKLEAALTNIEEAIKIVENIRGNVQSQDLRTSYFATVQGYYKFYIDLLMELHKKDSSKICEFTTKDQNTNKDITIKDKCKAVALHISERSRARGLVELLTEARANIRKGANPELLAEESCLQDLINTKEKLRQEIVSNIEKINNPIYKARADKFQTEIDELLSQQKQLETKIRQSSPKYANLKYPQPLTLPQIQQQLDKDTLLLEYSLGKERSYLWAVTPNSIDSYELPRREEIEKAVTEFRETLIKCQKLTICHDYSPEEKAQALKDTAFSATKLSKIILGDVAEKLGKKRLVIVADGALQTIPFAALNDLTPQPPPLIGKGVGGEVSYQPLIVNHEIVNLPSVTAIATQRQELKRPKTPRKTLAILADPVFKVNDERITGKPETTVPNSDFSSQIEQSQLKQAARNLNRNGWERLKGTETEAKAILNIIPSSDNLQAFGFNANYNWVTNPQLSQYRFLHFATHGFADPNNPELSGIVLSQFLDKQAKPADKGYLRLGDIFNLDFAADLIVLSACDTGVGKDVNGEGLVGLTRGLMYAGAERVAVSLWQVDDTGAPELMKEFYRQMLKQGKSPAVALRAAQLKLWENSSLKNPYYWSAFTLQGEWR